MVTGVDFGPIELGGKVLGGGPSLQLSNYGASPARIDQVEMLDPFDNATGYYQAGAVMVEPKGVKSVPLMMHVPQDRLAAIETPEGLLLQLRGVVIYTDAFKQTHRYRFWYNVTLRNEGITSEMIPVIGANCEEGWGVELQNPWYASAKKEQSHRPKPERQP
jgi:hypothetical protein